MRFFKPENYFTVREALPWAGPADLIGNGCDCFIPPHPPREAIEARWRRANGAASDDHCHSVANPAKGEPASERGLPHQGSRGENAAARPLRRGGRSSLECADALVVRLFRGDVK
jgi:hypothetical protein